MANSIGLKNKAAAAAEATAATTPEPQATPNSRYSEMGPVYVAASPLENSLGFEIGFSTKSEKHPGVSLRTGLGIYLRSDHLGTTEKLPGVDL